MRYTRDIRTPADPQDFESTFDRVARPPRDFRVTKDTGDTLVVFEFQEFVGAPEREATVGYRAYFVPLSATLQSEINTTAKRQAALRIGRLCGAVTCSGRGEWIKLSSADYAGQKGFYLAVGVNRRGVESEPTIAYPSPYGITP